MPEPYPHAWHIFRGTHISHDVIFPAPPPWRKFSDEPLITRPLAQQIEEDDRLRATTYISSVDINDHVNAALYLRRPLLVTGEAGAGKSSLAYAIAWELNLGPVLRWPITSRSTVQQSLYQYDPISRVHEKKLSEGQAEDIGRYIRLGPLGTAFLPTAKPRVLLIDEIDKGDIDLPNDLLDIFEEGEFRIPELVRMTDHSQPAQVYPDDGDDLVPIYQGKVRCNEFPIVVMTSNGERDFSAPFLRRCIRLHLDSPNPKRLTEIVNSYFKSPDKADERHELIAAFDAHRRNRELATDQLLNAIFLTCGDRLLSGESSVGDRKSALIDILLKSLSEVDS